MAEQLERHRILNEGTQKPQGNLKESLNKKFNKPNIPGTLNTKPLRPIPPVVSKNSNNPLQSLLNETAMGMTESDDFAFNTDDVSAQPVNFFQPVEAAVGDVEGMLSTARPSSDVSMVQINEVPDYTQLMQKMLAKGVM